MKFRWWKTAEEIRNEVLEQVRKEREEEKAQEKKEEEERQAEIKRIEQEAAEKREKEPWVDINGIVEDPKRGLRVDLDWNDAFVEYLRDNGITGVDDEVVVQKWITMLYRDLIEQNQNENGSDNGLL